MNYPTSLDNGTSLPNPTGTSTQNNPDHASLHSSENAAIIAVETKLGTGSSTPASNTLLVGTGAGTSAWSQLTSSQLAAILTDETGSGSAVFANTPTLITPKVDTINENTLNNGVTVGGVNLKSGVVGANAVATASIQAAAVTASKIGTDSSFAWTTWTPTVANFTIGNGSLSGFYAQIGKTVFGRMSLTFGSTTAFTGQVTITAPITLRSGYNTQQIIGSVHDLDISANNYFGPLLYNSTTVLDPRVYSVSGSLVSTNIINATTPQTWAVGDSLDITFNYEAA